MASLQTAILPSRRRLARALDSLREAVLLRLTGMSSPDTNLLARKFKLDIQAAFGIDSGVAFPRGECQDALEFLTRRLPWILEALLIDAQAALDRDPSARSLAEVALCYPGFEAVAAYRVAHELRGLGVPLLPRLISETAHSRTGIDIHPGAEIGSAFFIDHGGGTVVGETSRIGNDVTLYHGVTLGILEKNHLIRGAKRHPTLEDGVTVYAQAMVLGGETVIGAHSVIGAQARVCRSVPPYSKIISRDCHRGLHRTNVNGVAETRALGLLFAEGSI